MPKIDYADILKAATGSTKLAEKNFAAASTTFAAANAANTFLKSLGEIDPAMLQMLIALLVSLFNKNQGEPAPPVAPPQPQPPVTPPVTPTPPTPVPPTPVPQPPGTDRQVARLTTAYFWITEDGKLKTASEFNEIISRETPLREGARVCINNTPWDQFGKELKPEAYGPLAWKEDGTPRMRYYGNNPDVTSITGGSHSLGNTPVLKCDRNTLDDDQLAETGQTYAVWEGEEDEITGPALGSLRIRGEKNR